MNDPSTVLSRLAAVIDDRNRRRPADSYTTELFAGGVEVIGAKIGEEAAELVEAARVDDQRSDARTRQHVIYEAADLLYHLLVLLATRDLTLGDVEAELARRFGTSGLDEKSSRTDG